MSDTAVNVRKFSAGVAVAAILIAAIGASGLIAVQFFRGFEMSDEAFVYSLTLAGGSLDRGWFFSYAYLAAPLFDLVGQQVWAMRVLRFLLYLVVGLVLILGVTSVLQRLNAPRQRLGGWAYFALVAATFIGSYWAWVYLPPVISYNEVAVWFALLAVTPMLLIEGNWLVRKKWSPVAAAFVSGIFLILLVFAKLPTALGLLAVLVAYIFLLRGPSVRWLYAGVGLALGAIATWLVTLLAGLPTTEIIAQGTRSLATGEGAPGGYEASTLLRDYLVTIQDSIFVLRGPIFLFVLAALMTYLLYVRDAKQLPTKSLVQNIAVLVAAALIGLSLWWAWRLGLGLAGADEAFSIGFAMALIAVAGVLLAIIATIVLPATMHSIWLRMTLLLLVTPILVVVGTNNPVTFQLHLAITPVLLLAVAAGVVIWQRVTSYLNLRSTLSIGAALLAFGVSAFTLSAIWQGIWSNPYRQVPLNEQTFANPTGILRFVSTDEGTFNIAQGLPLLANQLGLTQAATTAWDNPGLVLFFNNSQFASTWQLPLVTTSTDELFKACVANPQPLIVLDDDADERKQRSGDPTFFYQAVSSCGVKYPDDYVAIATLPAPANSGAISSPLSPSAPTPPAPVQVRAPK